MTEQTTDHAAPLTLTYKIGPALYVNVTNRCNADCVFCDRKGAAVVNGYSLKMPTNQEPDADAYIRDIADPKNFSEIVFCGYGEPTIRWDVVKQIAAFVKANGGTTRMNTNGHGNVLNHRDITPELNGLIDTVSISLNSTDPQQHAALMNVPVNMHGEMLDFARRAKHFTRVVLSIVGIPEVDVAAARKLATEDLGVEFREREYFAGGSGSETSTTTLADRK
jgi:TatD DNase family protein